MVSQTRDVVDLIEAHLHSKKHAPALRYAQETLTGGEAWERIGEFADVMMNAQVNVGTPIALLMERGCDYVCAMLACMKVGSPFIPLDIAASHELLYRQIATIDNSSLLFNRSSVAPALLKLIDHTVITASSTVQLARRSALQADDSSYPGVAYMIFTSGTSGLPKPVAITVHALEHYCRSFIERLGGVAELTATRVAVVTTLSADLAYTLLFTGLMTDALVDVVSNETAQDPESFRDQLMEEQYDVIKTVPTHIQSQIEWSLERSLLPALPKRHLILGGELFSWGLLDGLRAARPRCRIWNHYGPSETCIGVAMGEAKLDEQWANDLRAKGLHSVPIGLPMGATLLNLDHSKSTAYQADGELLVSGLQLSIGYVGKIRETADSFRPSQGGEGDRCYRTGDSARWVDGHGFEIVGRVDRQVKLRGYRIDLNGIEAIIRGHEDVVDAYAATLELGELGHVMCVWVAGSKGITVTDIRTYLAARIPEPALPSKIVILGSFPKTNNGKLDTRRLCDSIQQRPSTAQCASDLDEVKQLFAAVLGVATVADDSDFFQFGGNSLAAVKLIGRLRAHFGRSFTLREFAKNPCPFEVLRHIKAGRQDESVRERPGSSDQLLLTPQQEALWIHVTAIGESDVYEIPLLFRITGAALDPIRLTIEELLLQHEILRTVYEDTGSALNAQVLDGNVVKVAVYPTRELLVDVLKNTHLDLKKGPVVVSGIAPGAYNECFVGLKVHHMAFDQISADIFAANLARSLNGGGSRSISERCESYASCVMDQRDGAKRPTANPDPFSNDLALGRTSPAEHVASQMQLMDIPHELVKSLEKMARESGATLFGAAMSIWALVLSRQANEESICIATAADLREDDMVDVVGFFSNTVPILVRVHKAVTFAKYIQTTHIEIMDALENRHIPYSWRVALAHQQRLSGEPRSFFSIIRHQRMVDGNIAVEQLPWEIARATFDLDLTLRMDAESATLSLSYRPQACDEQRALSLIEQFAWVLGQVVKQPTEQVRNVLTTPPSQLKKLHDWSRGITNRASSGEAKMRKINPGYEQDLCHSAIVSDYGRISVGEFRELVCSLRRGLSAQGIGTGDVVALALDTNVDWLRPALWNALFGAKCPILALDPAWPTARKEAVIRASNARWIIRDVVVNGGKLVSATIDEMADSRSQPGQGKGLAFIVCTSGSTGQPKAVAIGLRAFSNHLSWMKRRFPLSPDSDVVLALTSPGFDVAAWEMVGPIQSGATLVVPQLDRRTDFPYLLQLIQKERVTVMQTVPSLLSELSNEQTFIESNIRLILCGGEALPVRLADRLRKQMPRTTLANMYGPTEATIDATYHVLDQQYSGMSVPIGRPVEGVLAYVVDDFLRLVPIGGTGQLAIGGDNLACGYLNDTAQTALKFVPNPHSDKKGARLYLTGDLVRWNFDGTLRYLGREDGQVKLHGHRIELAEVEATIRVMPQVSDAAVVLQNRNHPSARLAAFVTLTDGVVHDMAEGVRDALSRELPQSMVPSTIMVLPYLPMLTNGKVDRSALEAMDTGSETPSAPSGNATERCVSHIWATTLGVDQVDIDRPFFWQGGNSLLLIRLRSALEKEFHTTIRAEELFEHVTVRQQARLVSRIPELDYPPSRSPLKDRPRYELLRKRSSKR